MADVTGADLLPVLAGAPGHVFWRARARVGDAIDEILPAGVDIHAYAALLALSGGATRSQQAVADMISVSRTTMAKVAADLAERGLLTRVRNPEDRRSYSLTRTAEGAAAARRWRRHAEDVEDTLTAGFTLREREELRAMLLSLAAVDLAPDVPEPLKESIGFLITRIHNRLHREFSAVLAPLGIEPAQFGALMTLGELGPVTQAEIARSLGTSGAHVVKIVDSLEERGIVERRRSQTDRRAQLVHLRPRARKVHAEAERLAAERADVLLDVFAPTERERLLALLRRLITG